MRFSRVFSAMRLRRAISSCTSFAPARALALSVAWLMAPFAYSSWTLMARSALSIDTLARRAAVSTVAVESSDIGFAVVVAMAVLLGFGRRCLAVLHSRWCAATIPF